MEEALYVIYIINQDNSYDIKGYIAGYTDASRYCEEYNKQCLHYWEKVHFEELKKMS